MSVVLSNKEKQILAVLADTIFPRGGKIPFSATDVGTNHKIDAICKNLPEDAQRGLKILLKIINLSPLLTYFKTFIKLDEKSRQKFFERWENSKLLTKRNIAMAIKGLVTMIYYNSSEVQKIIGYTPGCLKEQDDIY